MYSHISAEPYSNADRTDVGHAPDIQEGMVIVTPPRIENVGKTRRLRAVFLVKFRLSKEQNELHTTHDIGVASQIGNTSDAIEVRSNMRWLITLGHARYAQPLANCRTTL